MKPEPSMRVSVGMRSETIAPRAGGRSGNPSADADLPAGLRPGAVHEDEGGLPLGEPDDRHRLALDADPRDAVLLDENAGDPRRAEAPLLTDAERDLVRGRGAGREPARRVHRDVVHDRRAVGEGDVERRAAGAERGDRHPTAGRADLKEVRVGRGDPRDRLLELERHDLALRERARHGGRGRRRRGEERDQRSSHRSRSALRKYSSPCSTRRREIRSPWNQVPFDEPRSSMDQPSAARTSATCSREIFALSMTRSQWAPRPMTYRSRSTSSTAPPSRTSRRTPGRSGAAGTGGGRTAMSRSSRSAASSTRSATTFRSCAVGGGVSAGAWDAAGGGRAGSPPGEPGTT